MNKETKAWEEFLVQVNRNEESVRAWSQQALEEELHEQGFKGSRKGDVQAYWKSLQVPPPSAVVIPTLPQGRATYNSWGWIKELTRECVEPNPGPTMEKVFKSLREELGKKIADIEGGITKLESTIQAQHGTDLVMHEDVRAYITHNQQKINSIFGEKRAAQVVQLLVEVLPPIAPPPSVPVIPTLPQAPHAVVEFWNALPNAKLTEYKGKGKKKADGNKVEPTFLELTVGTYFLGEKKFGSRLLVRECYKELIEVTFGIIEGGSDLVITGNPGIGKSFFLFYFLYLLRVKDPDATVVVYRHLENRWYLFSKDGISTQVGAKGQEVFDKYLTDPNTWYLVDTATPLEVKAKTLLLSSPYVQQYKEFRKTNAHICFMPVWSKEEIDICRQEFYNNTVSQEQANELYRKWEAFRATCWKRRIEETTKMNWM
eukprot:Phypoly_transcript_03882.p1 GENE.Phypoly_transcript_03882~~Phypoly_transcript_03882.p1  ORF type:complete len:429 (+),score=66.04 Phypoly_transcript_03882:89-1375(+)